jgi:4-amino-4-deoxy-L-arabinose transferase-like glycosyltransferase
MAMQTDVSGMAATRGESIGPRRGLLSRLFQNRAVKNNFDLALLAIIIAGFIPIAASHLGTAPLPDTDESMTLQVPYEMLRHGKLAFPMYRHLGGNIENVWHSYTPVFFLLLSGFMKIFGWGLLQGRAFNLLMAALVLLMTHLVGRRLFDWRAGLIAVGLLVSEPTFLDRSRVVRNDYAGAVFALLAFYLYDLARQRRQSKLYFAAGLAAGAGVMCHTNVLYTLAAIGALMLLDHGWRIARAKGLCLFAAGAFAVMAYEIVYDIIDSKNFLSQNRQDDMHFNVLNVWGWWGNLLDEPTRYERWYNGFLKVGVSMTLTHVFLWLSAAGITYLVVRSISHLRRKSVTDDPRARLLIATLVVALFFAVITQRKVVLYVIHLAPWFALSVGVMMRDGLRFITPLRTSAKPRVRLAFVAAAAAIACGVSFYAFHFARQSRDYLRAVSDPERATFDDLAGVLRSVVPEGVCPVGIKQGVLWLAFPEKDYCFAAIENRMRDALDIKGNEYAVIASARRKKKEGKLIKDITEGAKLIAELDGTAYGSLSVYYTGTNPAHLSLAPARYIFFGKERGHVSRDEVEAAREVWGAGGEQLSRPTGGSNNAHSPEGFAVQPDEDNRPVKLCSIDLKPATIYQLVLETNNQRGRWEIIITDEETSALLFGGRINERGGAQGFEGVFKTRNSGRIRVSLRGAGPRLCARRRTDRPVT